MCIEISTKNLKKKCFPFKKKYVRYFIFGEICNGTVCLIPRDPPFNKLECPIHNDIPIKVLYFQEKRDTHVRFQSSEKQKQNKLSKKLSHISCFTQKNYHYLEKC